MFRKVKIQNGIELCDSEGPTPKNLSDYGLKEAHVEELLRQNIDLIIEEESFLIVGQQIINKDNARNDLVGVDESGNLVLIEIKRDLDDCKSRKEPFEFQAIRYTASLATIKTPEELINQIYAPYIEKHREEHDFGELTSFEYASRKLLGFLDKNNAQLNFNEKQRIILVSSGFEDQALSAVSWLIKNGIDISCFSLTPYEVESDIFLSIEKVLPSKSLEDFYVEFKQNEISFSKAKNEKIKRQRNYLPRMGKLFEWGIIKAGDEIFIKDRPESLAVAVDEKTVTFNGETIAYNRWGEKATGWSSICIYEWAILKKENKLLADLRAEKMKEVA